MNQNLHLVGHQFQLYYDTRTHKRQKHENNSETSRCTGLSQPAISFTKVPEEIGEL